MAIWPFSPQYRIVESLEWETAVLESYSAEQRHSIRPIPRRLFEMKHELEGVPFGRAREIAKSTGGNQIDLPLWIEHSHLGALNSGTVNLPIDGQKTSYKAGGKLIVWDDQLHCEARTIYSIGSGVIQLSAGLVSSYSDAYVMPSLSATFTQALDVERSARDQVIATGRFEAVETADLSTQGDGLIYPYFRDYPVVTDPNVRPSLSEEFSRDVELIDSVTGALSKLPILGRSKVRSAMTWIARSKDEIWDLRLWIHSRKGRRSPFWIPSWNADLTITAPIAQGATTIEIEDISYYSAYPSTADFLIVCPNGPFGVRVIDCDPGSTGKQILTIDTPMPDAIALEDIERTSRLVLTRFDSDRIEIGYDVADFASVSVPVVEIPE